MKKTIITVLTLAMLCGCSKKADSIIPESSGDALSGSLASSEKIAENSDTNSELKHAENPDTSSELKHFGFGSAEEVEAISDEDLVYIAKNNYSTSSFISDIDEDIIDLFGVPLLEKEANGYVCKERAETYLLRSELPIEELDVNESISDDVFRKACEKNCDNLIKAAYVWHGDTGSKTKDEVTIRCGENDLYAEYSIRFTDMRTMYLNDTLVTNEIPRAYRRLFLKNRLFVPIDERVVPVYFGELTLENVKAEMDLMISLGGLTVYREVGETENAYIYTSYMIVTVGGDYGLCDMAELIRYDNIFDKTTHEQSSSETCVRRVDIPGTMHYPDNEW